jgi:hypothetical protein
MRKPKFPSLTDQQQGDVFDEDFFFENCMSFSGKTAS